MYVVLDLYMLSNKSSIKSTFSRDAYISERMIRKEQNRVYSFNHI